MIAAEVNQGEREYSPGKARREERYVGKSVTAPADPREAAAVKAPLSLAPESVGLEAADTYPAEYRGWAAGATWHENATADEEGGIISSDPPSGCKSFYTLLLLLSYVDVDLTGGLVNSGGFSKGVSS